MIPSYWTEWASTERDAGKDMNITFMNKWWSRDEHARTRGTPGDWLSGTRNVTGDTVNVWVDSGWGTTRLWIPPWADKLVTRVSMAVSGDIFDVEAEILGYVRPKIGTSLYGTEMRIWLACEVGVNPGTGEPVCRGIREGADGRHTTMSGDLLYRESVIVIDDAVRNTEQDLGYETKKGTNFDTQAIRIFNNVRDVTDGARYRSWYWVEAER